MHAVRRWRLRWEALDARIVLLGANPADIEPDATALANGDDHVGVDVGRADPYAKRAVLAGRSGLRLSSVLPVAECADEPACLGAVEHDGRGLAVPEGAEPDERGLSGGA